MSTAQNKGLPSLFSSRYIQASSDALQPKASSIVVTGGNLREYSIVLVIASSAVSATEWDRLLALKKKGPYDTIHPDLLSCLPPW